SGARRALTPAPGPRGDQRHPGRAPPGASDLDTSRGACAVADSDAESGALARLQDDPTSRKRFLRMVGGAGATGALGLLIAACGGGDRMTPAATSTGGATTAGAAASAAARKSDLAIVNYALTLEYL